MLRKTWHVSLYKGADVDPSYKRLSRSDDKVYGHSYDGGISKYVELKPAYEMDLASIVVPNRPIKFDISKLNFYDVYSCNYLVAKSEANPNQIYYGFIKEISYVNDGMAEIQWAVDFWATYRNSLDLSRPQLILRAAFAPKEIAIDARRTVDSSMPTDDKNRLVYTSDLLNNSEAEDQDGNTISFDNWYLFYVMPKSAVSGAFGQFGQLPDVEYSSKEDPEGSFEFTPNKYKDLTGATTDDETKSVKWLNFDNAFKELKSNFKISDFSALDLGVCDVYASKDFNDILKLNLIAGEGYAIIGCEVRNCLNLGYFEKQDNGLYMLIKGFDTSNLFYEGDNYKNLPDHKFSNLYDKNRYREELLIDSKSVNVDPSLRMTGKVGVHLWDSVIPGFKPMYSFYHTNGQISYISPKQAGSSDLLVQADSDRSVPIYADKGLAYYFSHLNRINATIKKEIISWKAQIRNQQLSYGNQLRTIAENYNVSLLDLKNALYTNQELTNFNNSKDKSLLSSTNDNTKNNAAKQNKIDNDILSANNNAAKTNLVSSQITAEGNLTASQKTALANLKTSQQISLDNLQTSQGASVANLENSQKAQLANLSTANLTQKAIANSSNSTQKDNNTAQADQNKKNLDTSLANQKTNLELQKAESFVTGLNLTAGIAKFLTGALTSLITGFLDIETAEAVASNNVTTQKKIIDDNLALSNDTILKNNLTLALNNLESSYSSSVTQTKTSQTAATENLKTSNTAAKTTLTNNNTAAESNLEASQATASANLKTYNDTAQGNLKRSQDTAVDNLAKSYQKELNSIGLSFSNSSLSLQNALTKALNQLKKNNLLSEANLNNATVKAYILAQLAQKLSQEQLANTITASVDSFVTDLKAQMDDWAQGNVEKLTDGNGLAAEKFKLFTPVDKIYEVQASTERQFTDSMRTYGMKINRSASIKQLVTESANLTDYFLKEASGQKSRQFLQTSNCQLEGNAPTEALESIQNAFNSGVYITIENAEGSVNNSVKQGTDWVYDEPTVDRALSNFSSMSAENSDWQQGDVISNE